MLWQHCNDCVFNGTSPRLSTTLTLAGDDIRSWSMASAKGITLLTGTGGDVES
jgi:hypothetical protein